MGRQIAVAMSDCDEEVFLAFLRSIADIQILESCAPTKEAFRVNGFAPRERGHWQYLIWNKAFPWHIEYAQVDQDTPGDRQGWLYVQRRSIGPVIEYDRHSFSGRGSHWYGRLYWAKPYAAGQPGSTYDVGEFTRWYNRVVRWVRKHEKQREQGTYKPYYLPGALTYDGAP